MLCVCLDDWSCLSSLFIRQLNDFFGFGEALIVLCAYSSGLRSILFALDSVKMCS